VTSVLTRPVPAARRPGDTRGPADTLFRRLLLFNVVVVTVAGVLLAITPVTVSNPLSGPEGIVLALGSALMVAINAVLVRATLRPLDGLTSLMERVDLLRPGQRLAPTSDRTVGHLVDTFNQMLDRLEHEREASSAHALAAQEDERRRIARELHDEVGQSLTAVLLGLRRTADRCPEPLRGEVAEIQETVRDCLDEVRTVARRLRPGVLDDLGLSSALHALGADVSRAGDLPVTVRIDDRLPDLPPDTELAIYRVAQEGLTNVTRHADATSAGIEVVVGRRGEKLFVRIVDDGRGPVGAVEGGGIRGMRERAILVHGDLTVNEAPGGGTRLELAVPLGPLATGDDR
jgi:two-component system sensor histidine kinase UhpB